jgi:hypothetical protein
MRSQAKALGLRGIYLQQRLFDTIVAPVMSYCSEVWGPDLLADCASPVRMLDNPLQKVQTDFLRHHGCIRASAPLAVLYREFVCTPMARHWFTAIISFWNRVAGMARDEWVHQALRESILMHKQAADGEQRTGWAACVVRMLSSLGATSHADMIGNLVAAGSSRRRAETSFDAIPVLDAELLLQQWDTVWDSPWSDLPPAHQSPRCLPVADARIKLVTYNAWMSVLPTEQTAASDPPPAAPWYPDCMPRYVRFTHECSDVHLKQLIRFRCGSHDLGIETGRWQQRARQQRCCTKCSQHVIDDEFHMVMECPSLHSVRAQYATLFEVVGGYARARHATPEQMRVFMNQKPAVVAAFIYDCLALRDDLPDVPPYLDFYGLAQRAPSFSSDSD